MKPTLTEIENFIGRLVNRIRALETEGMSREDAVHRASEEYFNEFRSLGR